MDTVLSLGDIFGTPVTFLTDFIEARNLDLVLLVKEKDTGDINIIDT